jgi:hypothetical protein
MYYAIRHLIYKHISIERMELSVKISNVAAMPWRDWVPFNIMMMMSTLYLTERLK